MTCKAPGLYFLSFTPISVALSMYYLYSIWILNLGHLLPIFDFDHLVNHQHHQLMNRYTNCDVILLPMEYYSVIEINEVLRVLQHGRPLETCWKKPDMKGPRWKVPFTRNVPTRQIQGETAELWSTGTGGVRVRSVCFMGWLFWGWRVGTQENVLE